MIERLSTPFKANIFRINDYYIRNLDKIKTSKLGWDYTRAEEKPQKLEEKGKEAA